MDCFAEQGGVYRHITSSTGSIGAAVAVSKILGLTMSETAHAIGLAATQVVGLREMFGSHTKSFHPGRAAQCGLLAAVMAQGGYTSSETTLEAKRGWANVVGSSKADILQSLDKWVGGEGEFSLVNNGVGRWEILRNSFKPFPCGIVIHPIIDACAQLHGEIMSKNLDIHKIKSVTAEVHPLVLELTGKKTPKDGLEAKFSVYHSGACGLRFGKATPAEYDDAVVLDPEVIAIRDRITAEINTALTPDQATVTVELEDGQVFTKTIEHAIGSLEVPLDETMLKTKFLDQCTPVLGEGATAASKACWEIEAAEDICNITQFM
jgi:2-methylcitrate dehydratase PrpD